MLDLESLFKLSYGMCIVSSKKDGKFDGCIVNTVFQLIPEPPMIAASVNRQNLTHEYITDSKVFTVSILSEGAPMPFIGKFGFRSGRDIDKGNGIIVTLHYGWSFEKTEHSGVRGFDSIREANAAVKNSHPCECRECA